MAFNLDPTFKPPDPTFKPPDPTFKPPDLALQI